MKFKEFWNISSQSQDPYLKEAVDNQTKKAETKYRQLIEESTVLDTQRRLIQIFENILNELDPEVDHQAILDLEYIIRLYREWADLNQEILTNLHIVNKSEIVEEELLDGDEWKRDAGLQKKEYQEKYELEPKSQLFKESVESMQGRINEIQEELEPALHDFERTSPKEFNQFFKLAEQGKENRTN